MVQTVLHNYKAREATDRGRFTRVTVHACLQDMTTSGFPPLIVTRACHRSTIQYLLSKLMSCLLLILLSSHASLAYASEAPFTKEGELPPTENTELLPDEPLISDRQLQLSFSNPEFWIDGDSIFYETTLTVLDISSLFGYQIQIELPELGGITVENLVRGLETAPVYQNGSLYLAVLNTERMSGDVSICTITCCFAVEAEDAGGVGGISDADDAGSVGSASSLSDTRNAGGTGIRGVATGGVASLGGAAGTGGAGGVAAGSAGAGKRCLIVRSFQAVTSISSEEVIRLGPEPAAAVIEFHTEQMVEGLVPAASSASGEGLSQILLVLALIFVVAMLLVLVWKLRQPKANSNQHWVTNNSGIEDTSRHTSSI